MTLVPNSAVSSLFPIELTGILRLLDERAPNFSRSWATRQALKTAASLRKFVADAVNQGDVSVFAATCDLWTSMIGDSFLVVTVRWISRALQMRHVPIACLHVAETLGPLASTAAENISVLLRQVFKSCGVPNLAQSKVDVMWTTDRGLNIVNAVKSLKTPRGGWMGCLCHRLHNICTSVLYGRSSSHSPRVLESVEADESSDNSATGDGENDHDCAEESTSDSSDEEENEVAYENNELRIIVKRIQYLVTVIRRRSKLHHELKRLMATQGVRRFSLRLAVSTRWNSMLAVVKSLMSCKDVIVPIIEKIDKEHVRFSALSTLSKLRWVEIAECVSVLEVPHNLTLAFSATSTSAVALVIPLLKQSFFRLQQIEEDKRGLLCGTLAKSLLVEFHDAFDNIEDSNMLSMATLLDPRFRAHSFRNHVKGLRAESCLQEMLNESSAALALQVSTPFLSTTSSRVVSPTVDAIHGQSASVVTMSTLSAEIASSPLIPSTQSLNAASSTSIFQGLASVISRPVMESSIHALDVLRSLPLPPEAINHASLSTWDVIAWVRCHSAFLSPSILSLMRNLHVIFPSSVSSESTLSQMGDIITKKRCTLRGRTAEAILLTKISHSIGMNCGGDN